MSKSLPSFATRSSPQRRTSSHTPVLNYCGFAGLLCKISLGNLMDPIKEHHLKMTIKEWGTHYNRGRPHSSVGPGLPDQPRTAFRRAAIDTSCPAGTVL